MNECLILNSGGYDSVAMAKYLKKSGFQIEVCLFFDYGQRALEQERRYAERSSRLVGAKFVEIKLPPMTWSNSATIGGKDVSQYIELRNVIFLSYAASVAESMGISLVFSAIYPGLPQAGVIPYKDTTYEFIEETERYYSRLGILFRFPFKSYYKSDIGELVKVRIGEFFSCNVPREDGQPCGRCSGCLAIQEMLDAGLIHPRLKK